jgi:azi5
MSSHVRSTPVETAHGAHAVLEIATGLWRTQTLVAALEIGLFEFLTGDGLDVAETSRAAGIEERPADVLLTACTALGLLVREKGRYRLGPEATQYLVPGRSDYLGDYVRMLHEYANPGWIRAGSAVKSNFPSKVIPNYEKNMFDVGQRPDFFWDGLFAYSTITARALVGAIDLSGARLLDVGGGTGAFVIELCRSFPDLVATVYDLPHVCDKATEKISAACLADRINTKPGDFFDEELPSGYNTMLLSMILHDWDESTNGALLEKCFRALPPGGRVLVSELILDDDRTGPLDAALMSMNMLVGTWGRNYTESEYVGWLQEAGFREVRTVRYDGAGANGVLVGVKP